GDADFNFTCVGGGWWSYCAQLCARNQECREAQVCRPLGNGWGYCGSKCLSDDDCPNGESCRTDGFCGDDHAPAPDRPEDEVDEQGDDNDDQANACACD